MWNPRKVYIAVVLLILTSTILFGAQSYPISITFTTSTPSVTTGSQVDYSITIQHPYNSWVLVTNVAVVLPVGFTYVSGSTSGSSTSDPSISGNQLTWDTWWTLHSGESVTFNFSALASSTTGTYDSYASTWGYRFEQSEAGPTTVTATGAQTTPLLVLNKTVNNNTSNPGDELTYTMNYINSGDGPAYNVTIHELIPATTDYIVGSASGEGVNIYFSHDGGETYDLIEVLPITDLSFRLSSVLNAGANGSISFKVKVK